MRRVAYALALVLALLVPSCASGRAAVTKKLPEVAKLVNPQVAEEAVYAAAKVYAAAVGTINQLHAAGKVNEATYQRLVAAPDSVANRCRLAGSRLQLATERWRAGTGTKDEVWTEYDLVLTTLGDLLQVAGVAR